MPGKIEIMGAVRHGLDGLNTDRRASDTVWTKDIKTKLCEIGRDEFRCKACASDAAESKRDFPEWLYDVTWLEYAADGPLVDAHLVAECEWGNLGNIDDDFEKLLLARASVRTPPRTALPPDTWPATQIGGLCLQAPRSPESRTNHRPSSA